MLRHFGAEVTTATGEGRTRITIKGETELRGCDVAVPGDPSSAAFLVAAAVVVPGSDITVEGVLVNPTRTGLAPT
jgi:3-phosphoshikimate 1-carboxyvinyltransferase